MPSLPEALADVSADPATESFDFSAVLRQLEIVPPSTDVLFPLPESKVRRVSMKSFSEVNRDAEDVGCLVTSSQPPMAAASRRKKALDGRICSRRPIPSPVRLP
jgi:hypothetical protein